MEDVKKERVPVYLITGFLGAGKTTVLNQFMSLFPETRFGIIENEFGDISIDQELLVHVKEEVFGLSGGCLCCSLNSDLEILLSDLLTQHGRFDHLIVETTGMADPAPVASTFLFSAEIRNAFELKGTIAVVDAKNVEEQVKMQDEALRQIGFADLILVNKTDLVTKENLIRTWQFLKKINPTAIVEPCERGKFDPQILLRIGAYRASEQEKAINNISFSLVPADRLTTGAVFAGTTKSNIKHSDVVSYSFELDGYIDLLKFMHWINVLLRVQDEYVYRIKGILNVKGHPDRLIFHSVSKDFEFGGGSLWKENEKRSNKIVFIGKGVRREILEKNLLQCIAE